MRQLADNRHNNHKVKVPENVAAIQQPLGPHRRHPIPHPLPNRRQLLPQQQSLVRLQLQNLHPGQSHQHHAVRQHQAADLRQRQLGQQIRGGTQRRLTHCQLLGFLHQRQQDGQNRHQQSPALPPQHSYEQRHQLQTGSASFLLHQYPTCQGGRGQNHLQL